MWSEPQVTGTLSTMKLMKAQAHTFSNLQDTLSSELSKLPYQYVILYRYLYNCNVSDNLASNPRNTFFSNPILYIRGRCQWYRNMIRLTVGGIIHCTLLQAFVLPVSDSRLLWQCFLQPSMLRTQHSDDCAYKVKQCKINHTASCNLIHDGTG